MNNEALKVEQWPIDRLIEYARNPRKNDAKVDQMAAAIREFGFRIPIVAKSDGSVVDGHLRLKAARKQQAELEFAEPGELEVDLINLGVILARIARVFNQPIDRPLLDLQWTCHAAAVSFIEFI
jgi:ParB-like chromosome segregation protein Spo0J